MRREGQNTHNNYLDMENIYLVHSLNSAEYGFIFPLQHGYTHS